MTEQRPDPTAEWGVPSPRLPLETEHDRLKAVISQLPAVVNILKGPDLVFELAHPFTVKYLGGRELQGKPLLEAMPEHRDQPFCKMLQHVLRTGETVSGKERLVRFDRTNTGQLEDSYWSYTYVPLRNAGGDIEGVMTFDAEVTEQVLARRQREAMMAELTEAHRRKDEFLAMLAHELRNPLAPMQTSVYLARQQLAGSSVDSHLEIVERQVNHLARIVDDLLDVSRITHGTIGLRQEQIDLGQAALRAMETVGKLFDSRRHAVSVALPRRLVYVNADSVRLDQIVINLLTNAAKYTEPGGRIWVSVERAGEMAELRVRDNGIGIAPELRPHLFELFRQGSRDLARMQGGLGIGLTIVHNLVKLHGGTIEVVSGGPGTGSEFIVRIPYIEENGDAVVPAAAPETEAAEHAAPEIVRRILIVDDNKDAAESLAQLIELFGHDVRFVLDGPSAIAAVEQWCPDLVFLDIGLPGMDGYQVAKRLRSNNADTPVLIALTGYGQEADRRKSREAGFTEHLVKPPEIQTIEAIVNSAVVGGTLSLH